MYEGLFYLEILFTANEKAPGITQNNIIYYEY